MIVPYTLSQVPVKAIVLDIEGTTTPIVFVYEVLFPFARTHLKKFLERNPVLEEVKKAAELLFKEHETDVAKMLEPPFWNKETEEAELDSIYRYTLWLMDRDRKSTGLKLLQGKIWEEGFKSRELHGEIYPDVLPALKHWKEKGIDLRIYSSGSILAQKLLFSYTTEGDLTRFFQGYFDTTTGQKNSTQSYKKISRALRVSPSQVLFVSDSTKELDAAKRAGMQTIHCIRSANLPENSSTHPIIQSFNDIVD